jgi:hypothetical protein
MLELPSANASINMAVTLVTRVIVIPFNKNCVSRERGRVRSFCEDPLPGESRRKAGTPNHEKLAIDFVATFK